MEKQKDEMRSFEYQDLKEQCDMQDKTIRKLAEDIRKAEDDLKFLHKKIRYAVSFSQMRINKFPDDRPLTKTCIIALVLSLISIVLNIYLLI